MIENLEQYKAKQYSRTQFARLENQNLFAVRHQCVLSIDKERRQKIIQVMPALNDSYIVHSCLNGRHEQQCLKHISSKDQLMDCERFEQMDEIVAVKVMDYRIVVVAYLRKVGEGTRRVCNILQWNLQSHSKLTVEHNQIDPKYYRFELYSFQNLFCLVELSSESRIIARLLEREEEPNCYNRFNYYQFPIANVSAKPLITLNLKETKITGITKINNSSSIAMTTKDGVYKLQYKKFFILSIDPATIESGTVTNAGDYMRQYEFKHQLNPFRNQDPSVRSDNVYQIGDNIIYYRCVNNFEGCCKQNSINYKCHSYFWDKHKGIQSQPITFSYIPKNHWHNIQFLNHFFKEDKQNLQRHVRRIADFFENNQNVQPNNQNFCYFKTYFINPENGQLLAIKKNRIVRINNQYSMNTFTNFYSSTEFLQYSMEQDQKTLRIKKCALAEYALGMAVSWAFLLSQKFNATNATVMDEADNWNEDLLFESIQLLKAGEEQQQN